MNNPNPFVPKGSLMEQQNQRRTQMKYGVLCVLAVSVAGLMAMLIQGCTKKSTEELPTAATEATNPVPTADATVPIPDSSNPAPTAVVSNPPITPTPLTPVTPMPTQVTTTATTPLAPAPNPTPLPPPTADPGPAAGGEYTVAKGDSLAKIAKKNGVTLKALEAANPTVKPAKLKIGQKLTIPAGGKATADTAAAPTTPTAPEATGETYTVKSGDTLTKIAKAHHLKLKELQAANGLTTTKIKVGEKLKLPSKGEASAPDSMPAPPVQTGSNSPVAPVVPAPVQH